MSTQFWFVRARSAKRDTWADIEDVVLREGELPPPGDELVELYRRIAAGDLSMLAESLRFKVVNRGKRVGDMLWSTGVSPHVVSDRFVQVLTEGGSRGWVTYPITVHYANGEPLPGYQGLVITGVCGDYTKTYDPATVFVDEIGDKYARGIDPANGWDGSDLFSMDGRPGHKFLMTARTLEALDDAGITGIERQPAEDYEVLVEAGP